MSKLPGTQPDEPARQFKRELLDDQDTMTHYLARLSEGVRFCRPQWTRAEKNHRYASGNQWDDDVVQRRTERSLPTFTINDTVLIINALSGREMAERWQTTFMGRESPTMGPGIGGVDDAAWANALREFDRKILDDAHAPQYDSEAFRDNLIGGYSWVSISVDYMENPRGRIKITPIPVWDMVWDPAAKHPCLLDREWDVMGTWESVDQFLGMYPEKEKEITAAVNASKNHKWMGGQGKSHRYAWVYRSDDQSWHDETQRALFVNRYQWKQREPGYVIPAINPESGEIDPFGGGQLQVVTKEGLEELNQERVGKGWQPLMEDELVGPKQGFYPWRYYEAVILGEELIEEKEIPYGQFTRFCQTGRPKKTPQETSFQGLVDHVREPQRLRNEVITMAVSHLAKSRKGGMLVKANLFQNPQEAMQKLASESNPVILANNDANFQTDYQMLDHNEWPGGMERWLQISEDAVYVAAGGDRNTFSTPSDLRRISGRVYEGATQQAQQVNSTFFDSARLYRLWAGRLRLQIFKDLYDPGYMARVVGERHARSIPGLESFMAKTMDWEDLWAESFELDVRVEEVPVSKSEQFQFWEIFTQTDTLGLMLQNQMMDPELVVKMIPTISEPDRQQWIEFLRAGNAQQILQMAQEMPPEELQQVLMQLQALLQQPPPEGETPQEGVVQ